MEILSQAIRSNIPKKKINFHLTPFSNQIKSLSKFKNKLRKTSQKKPTATNKKVLAIFEKLVYKKIKVFNSNRFEKLGKKLKPRDGSFWKFCKRFSNKSENLPPIIFSKNRKEL